MHDPDYWKFSNKDGKLNAAICGSLKRVDVAYDDDDLITIPCCNCGRPTTFDATYGDLCYRCIRADNE